MKADLEIPTPPWHSMPASKVLSSLDSDRGGLAEEESARRRERFGTNTIPGGERQFLLAIVVRQFASPLIYLLLLAGSISLIIGNRLDAGFIFGVLFLNAAVGAFQEWRADSSSHALRALIPHIARVRRDDVQHELPSEAIVPGDIVELESGDRVPADLRLIETHGLRLDEAPLTGESLPVDKDAGNELPTSATLADRVTMAHAGTMVGQGRAVGVVVAIGPSTVIGNIGRSLTQTSRTAQASPLLRRMRQLTRQIAVGAVALILVLAALLAIDGHGLREISLLAIALAVSAIPEGLPVAVTVALSAAARRMAERNVIVRQLPAVEGLGSVTLIATDKTGTLTMNSLTVERAALPNGVIIDRDQWQAGGRPEELQTLGQMAALCNEATLDVHGQHIGDSMDVALLDFAAELGQDTTRLLAEQRLAIIPYEPVQRFAAVEVDFDGSPLLVAKGAPEAVLPMCTQAGSWAGPAAEAMARDGFRVLVLAAGKERGAAATISERLHELEVVGLVGLADPVRPGVAEAVRQCAAAGISVRMITGDHPVTALTIAKKIGLADNPSGVVTGLELAACGADAAAFRRLVAAGTVFARIEPTQKLAIVRAFQEAGAIVAVTGDGVNDGPALQAADIGVAMGLRGTDVARGAADLVLADDNFASIVAGVEEGRVTFLNVRKMVLFLLATGVAEIGMFLGSLVTGLPMPLTPVQLLWLNLVTNGIQDVTLGFGRGEGSELRQPAPRKLTSLLDREALIQLGAVAAAMTVIATWLLHDELRNGATVEQARNSVLLLTVLFQNVFLLSVRHLRTPVWGRPSRENPWLLAGIAAALSLHLAAMNLAPMQEMLGIAPVSLDTLMKCLAGSVLVLMVSELVKLPSWRSHRANQNPGTPAAS